MNLINLSIARDFSITPGGRKASEGKYSGEEFRKNFLEPNLKCEDEPSLISEITKYIQGV